MALWDSDFYVRIEETRSTERKHPKNLASDISHSKYNSAIVAMSLFPYLKDVGVVKAALWSLYCTNTSLTEGFQLF